MSATEAAVQAKIVELETKTKALKAEVTSIKGRIRNRDAAKIERLKIENTALEAQLDLIQRCYYGILMEPADPLQLDTLRKTAIDYFTQSNIDQELWKNIAF